MPPPPLTHMHTPSLLPHTHTLTLRRVPQRPWCDKTCVNGKAQSWPPRTRTHRLVSTILGRNGIHGRGWGQPNVPRHAATLNWSRGRRSDAVNHLQVLWYLAKTVTHKDSWNETQCPVVFSLSFVLLYLLQGNFSEHLIPRLSPRANKKNGGKLGGAWERG